MNRNRIIVKMAAAIVENETARSWLLMDERGSWEKEAGNLLESVREKAAGLGMAAEAVNDETAVVIACMATSAVLNSEVENG